MSRNNRHVRRRCIAALCLCVSLALAAPAFAEQARDIISQENIVSEGGNYNTMTIERGSYLKTANVAATPAFMVEADLSLESGSARLESIGVYRGTKVKAGDVLVRFTKHGSRAALEEQELRLNRTRAQLEQTKQSYTQSIARERERLSAMTDAYEIKMQQIAVERLELAMQRSVYQAEFDIAAQERALEENKEELLETELVAPFDGEVVHVAVKNMGDTIYAGETIVRVQSQESYLLRVDNSMGNYRYNMEVNVEMGPRTERTYYKGRVVCADNILPHDRRSGYAFIEMEELVTDPKELRNISAGVEAIRLDDVLLISRKAITLSGGKNFVSILDGQTVQKRVIVTGHNAAGETWVLQGLSEGQQVILDR